MLSEFNTLLPLKTDKFRQIWSTLRAKRTQFKERFELDHYMNNTLDPTDPTADGYHKQLTIPRYFEVDEFDGSVTYGEPDLLGNNNGVIFCMISSNKLRICFKNSAGTVII